MDPDQPASMWADDSYVISYLIFVKNRKKMLQNLSSAAVVIDVLTLSLPNATVVEFTVHCQT